MKEWKIPLLSLAAVLILAELALRSFVNFPAAVNSDPDIGWLYKPNSEVFETSEGRAINRINSYGFNDIDDKVSLTSPRLLVLGDSYTEAMQVPKEQNFTTLIENKSSCDQTLFNLGRAGLSPLEYPILISRFESTYQPDAALLVLNVSDYADIQHTTVVRDPVDGKITNILLRDQTLNSFRETLDPIISTSALFTYSMSRMKAFIASSKENDKVSQPISAEQIINNDKEVKDRINFLLDKMTSMIPLYVLYLPKIDYLGEKGVTTTEKSDRLEMILREATTRLNIPFLSPKKGMIDDFKKTNMTAYGFHNKYIWEGHLNPHGHELVADAATEFLLPLCY